MSQALPAVASPLQSAELRIDTAAALGLSDSEIGAFYREQWARPIALSRPDFTAWQMRAAPAANGLNHSVLAVEDGRILAVLGVTPGLFRSPCGRLRKSAELTTWIVAPETRGRGIGGAILKNLQERYDILMGAGITAAALPLYLKAGFTFLSHLPRFFYISDYNTITRFADAPAAAFRLSQHRQNQAPCPPLAAQSCRAADLADLAHLPQHHHNLRDAARLSWRYDQHPTWQYEAFRIGQMGVILRQDFAAETTILHVIDLFGDFSDAKAALAFVEAEAKRRAAAFVDFSTTNGQITAALRARGWNSSVDETLIELPSLFQPVELRRPPTTSVTFWARDDQAQLYDFGLLHITKGDMDLDRPTLTWMEANGK